MGREYSVARMKKEGGLPTLGMSRTIEDAIKVCVLLGQRYLWVDRLCIIQDYDEDNKNPIEAMNDIYYSAQLVLIAAYLRRQHEVCDSRCWPLAQGSPAS